MEMNHNLLAASRLIDKLTDEVISLKERARELELENQRLKLEQKQQDNRMDDIERRILQLSRKK